MAVEPEFRFAIIYLLLLRLIIIGVFSPRLDDSEPGCPAWRERAYRLFVQALFIGPVLMWVLIPRWLFWTQLNPHPAFRWLALAPAAAEN